MTNTLIRTSQIENLEIEINTLSYKTLWAYWNWSDWDVIISAWTTTLTRDMYYNNLTITSPWILNPNGFRVYVYWTFSWNRTVIQNGNNGTNWVSNAGGGWGWAGWAWATALNAWSLNCTIWWVNGGGWSATSASWAPWAAGINSNPTYITASWAAGWAGWFWWGSSGGWAAWAAWTSTRGVLYNTYPNLIQLLHPASNSTLPTTTQYKISWGSGGGGGGGDPFANPWAGGGGSGSSGWMIWISAFIFNFTWTLTAIGWNGWNGWNWNWGGGGGGGGWTGWILYLISSTFTSIWTQILTAWTGWTGWTTLNAAPWAPWAAWNAWTLIQITL